MCNHPEAVKGNVSVTGPPTSGNLHASCDSVIDPRGTCVQWFSPLVLQGCVQTVRHLDCASLSVILLQVSGLKLIFNIYIGSLQYFGIY